MIHNGDNIEFASLCATCVQFQWTMSSYTCDKCFLGELFEEALLLGSLQVKVETKDRGEDAQEHEQGNGPSGLINRHLRCK